MATSPTIPKSPIQAKSINSAEKAKPTTPEDDVDFFSYKDEIRRDMGRQTKRMIKQGVANELQRMHQRGEEPAPSLFRHFRGHHSTVNSVYFHPWKDTLLSCSSDGNILSWNYKDMDKRALRYFSILFEKLKLTVGLNAQVLGLNPWL